MPRKHDNGAPKATAQALEIERLRHRLGAYENQEREQARRQLVSKLLSSLLVVRVRNAAHSCAVRKAPFFVVPPTPEEEDVAYAFLRDHAAEFLAGGRE